MTTLPVIKIGCDPELFIRDTRTNQFVTAYGLLPGTKASPHKVPNGAIQVDGMAAEFNIDPVETAADWRKNIRSVMGSLREALPPYMELVVQPSVLFDKEYFWNEVPDEAKVLGCDPDFDAYTKGPNPRPNGSSSLRAAGGHIHIGWRDDAHIDDPDHLADCYEVIQQLDAYIGLATLLWDPDPTRRQMYGKAGAFRPKKYGCEYRTPSNMWLIDPVITDYVYHAANLAVSNLFKGKAARTVIGSRWAASQINGYTPPQNSKDKTYPIRVFGNYLKDAYMPGLSQFSHPMIDRCLRLATTQPSALIDVPPVIPMPARGVGHQWANPMRVAGFDANIAPPMRVGIDIIGE